MAVNKPCIVALMESSAVCDFTAQLNVQLIKAKKMHFMLFYFLLKIAGDGEIIIFIKVSS